MDQVVDLHQWNSKHSEYMSLCARYILFRSDSAGGMKVSSGKQRLRESMQQQSHYSGKKEHDLRWKPCHREGQGIRDSDLG